MVSIWQQSRNSDNERQSEALVLLLVYTDSTYFQADPVRADGFAGSPGMDSSDAQWLKHGEAPGCSLEEGCVGSGYAQATSVLVCWWRGFHEVLAWRSGLQLSVR